MLKSKIVREGGEIGADDLFKFLGALAMVTCHCFIFLIRALPADRIPQIDFNTNPHFFLPGFMSLALPALAGYGFKKFLNPYLAQGYLLNLNSSNIVKLLIGLILLDSIKNGILFGFIHAFKWDVLAFIVLSLLTIMWVIKKGGIKMLWALAALNILIMLVYLMSPVWISLSDSFVRSALEVPKVFLFLPTSLLLSAGFFAVWIYGSKKNQSPYIKWGLGTVLTVWIFICLFKNQAEVPYFWASIIKLPISVVIQLGQGGGHIWPLFPWMLLVLNGFFFAYYENWIFKTWKNALAVYVLAQVVFNVVLFTQFLAYRQSVAVSDFFSSFFFEPRWQVITLISTFYISGMIGYHYILRLIPFRSSFVKLYSNGILLFYFLHLIIAIVLLKPAIVLMPGLYVFTFYPILVNIISYFFLAGIEPILEKNIQINLLKR